MTWFKVDDAFWSHPKTLALSKNAVALWVRAGSYSGNHLTNGVINRDVLPMLQGTTEDANELVNAGLWIDHIDGYVFHDWEVYQPTRDSVEKQRESWRLRQQKSREKNEKNENIPSRPVPSTHTRESHRESRRDKHGDIFNEFWDQYPRKIGKGHARKAFEKAITKVDPNIIIDAAKRYRDDKHRDPQYTAHPSTWLNGERWDDQPPEIKQSGPVTVMDQYTEPCQHGDPRGSDKCALCRNSVAI